MTWLGENSRLQSLRRDRFNVDYYVSPQSDIVALMVLEHQVFVHNQIAKASFDTRKALGYDIMMNKTVENPAVECAVETM